jgi:hypothetical protein
LSFLKEGFLGQPLPFSEVDTLRFTELVTVLIAYMSDYKEKRMGDSG